MPFIREGSGDEGWEVKEGVVRGRGRRGILGQKREEGTYRRKGAIREMTLVGFIKCTHGLFSSFPDINTDMNKADLSDKTAP